MLANLKGISTKDVKSGSYIQMDVKQTNKRDDDASSGKQSELSYKSDDEEDQSPLRRQKLRMKDKLKTMASVPTSNMVSNSEVIATESSFMSKRKDNQTVIEEKSEGSTSQIETETNVSIHSKPQSLATIGVHDLYIGKD